MRTQTASQMLMQLRNRKHVAEAFLTEVYTSPNITWSHEKPIAFVTSTGIVISYRKYQIYKGEKYPFYRANNERYEFVFCPNARVKKFLKEQQFTYDDLSVFEELLTICSRYDKLKALGS